MDLDPGPYWFLVNDGKVAAVVLGVSPNLTLRERTVQDQNRPCLCGDQGFLDCTFSNHDPLGFLVLKKNSKMTSKVISGNLV